MTNCPPIYRNLQCESFSNKRKITSQMLRQFCKNDAYLYEQIKELWDATDPESRKRFYPPDFIDTSRSFGIESFDISQDQLEFYNYWKSVFRFNRTDNYSYHFDFDGTGDHMEYESDRSNQNVTVYADSLLDIETTYNEEKLEIVKEVVNESTGETASVLKPPVVSGTYEEIEHHKAQYTTVKGNTSTKYVTKKTEKLGKAKKDAFCYGAYKNWHCNSFWYCGFNRSKNYNIKKAWKKDQDSYDIPSVCRSQTFQALSSGRISKVSLNMQGSKSAVSPCIVEIRTTTKSGKPSTKVLARTEKKFTHSTGSITAFEFKNKALVKKGETYAIVVRSPLSEFGKTYRLGGWARTCFSNSKKQAYYKGDAYLSEDNGKTWIRYGKSKDGKSYGSHWYDWGIAEKPLDFGFEVFVQPVTTKAVKEKVTTTNKSYKKLVKEAYDEVRTYEYNYFKSGSYYLYLKPIQTNPIDSFYIEKQYTANDGDEYWAFEYYDNETSEWREYTQSVNFDNNRTNYTVLKLRIRCDILQNTFINTTTEAPDSDLQHLISTNKLSTTQLTYLKNFTVNISCFKPTKAYLRTLYYHPTTTEILGANIWSEIGVKAKTLNNATVEIDVIHEKESIEHFKFYDLNIINVPPNTTLSAKQQELVDIMRELITNFETSINASNYNTTQIIDYVYKDYKERNSVFINSLQYHLTPIYFLPLIYDGKKYNLFDDLQLPHLPSYPLACADVGDEDIVIDTSKFKGKSTYGVYYELDKDISKNLSSVFVSYYTNLDIETSTDENGFEINEIDSEERIEETLKGIQLDHNDILENGVVNSNVFILDLDEDKLPVGTGSTGVYSSVDYAVTQDGLKIVFNLRSPVIQALFPNYDDAVIGEHTFDFATTLDDTSVNDFQLKIDLTSKTFQEFVDFEVDYDTGFIHFYNQSNLVDGDFKVSYNPLWVRGLSVADFPLKMDLWKENYRIGTKTVTVDDETIVKEGMYKLKFDVENGYDVDDTFYEKINTNPVTEETEKTKSYYTFKTTVPPRDNIRKLILNDNADTGGYELEEDSQFFVDYLANRVTIVEEALPTQYQPLSENDVFTIHYTPNLTDQGLALGYRLSRPRYDDYGNVKEEYELEYDTSDDDDVLIGMNYFTYRT